MFNVKMSIRILKLVEADPNVTVAEVKDAVAQVLALLESEVSEQEEESYRPRKEYNNRWSAPLVNPPVTDKKEK